MVAGGGQRTKHTGDPARASRRRRQGVHKPGRTRSSPPPSWPQHRTVRKESSALSGWRAPPSRSCAAGATDRRHDPAGDRLDTCPSRAPGRSRKRISDTRSSTRSGHCRVRRPTRDRRHHTKVLGCLHSSVHRILTGSITPVTLARNATVDLRDPSPLSLPFAQGRGIVRTSPTLRASPLAIASRLAL